MEYRLLINTETSLSPIIFFSLFLNTLKLLEAISTRASCISLFLFDKNTLFTENSCSNRLTKFVWKLALKAVFLYNKFQSLQS